MVFELKGKVAIITGGASGIGLHYAKELLRNGAKGVTLADVSAEFGKIALKEIEEEFGVGKTIFVPTDVTVQRQVENAFKKTIETFKYIDILFNNAGVLNDAIWEKEIAINLNGTMYGILLAFNDYLIKHRQGDESVIVNVSSTAGTEAYPAVPVYVATKHGIIGLTKSWGCKEFYEETKIRVICLCPGLTLTPLISDISGRNLGERHEQWWQKELNLFLPQKPEEMAKGAMEVLKFAPNGTCWVVEGGQPAYEFIIPDHRATMKNNLLTRK